MLVGLSGLVFHGDGPARQQLLIEKIIRCDCGHVARGRDDDDLVAHAQQHAREVHGIEMTRAQALAMAKVV
jgi:predicted small metal-binding protein